MFTGIVQDMGLVAGVRRSGDDLTLVIESPLLERVGIGGSIAVNGTCLTAVRVDDGSVEVNVIAETTGRTNLGGLETGERVNLELPMTPESMFDGHMVQGHVDGVGTIADISDDGDSVRFRIEAGSALIRYLVEKGSVTLDGISLTVVAVSEHDFEVAIIPHTLEVTNMGLRSIGDKVNIEVDVLAKYVERLLDR